jgi:hypothetical protein
LDVRRRERTGITPQNPWLERALKKHPPETWRFEILESFKPGKCSINELRAAEQRWMKHYGTWKQPNGFNRIPAVWAGDGPHQRAARRWRAKIIRGTGR